LLQQVDVHRAQESSDLLTRQFEAWAAATAELLPMSFSILAGDVVRKKRAVLANFERQHDINIHPIARIHKVMLMRIDGKCHDLTKRNKDYLLARASYHLQELIRSFNDWLVATEAELPMPAVNLMHKIDEKKQIVSEAFTLTHDMGNPPIANYMYALAAHMDRESVSRLVSVNEKIILDNKAQQAIAGNVAKCAFAAAGVAAVVATCPPLVVLAVPALAAESAVGITAIAFGGLAGVGAATGGAATGVRRYFKNQFRRCV
jgi:hypothetical protein